MSYGKDVDYAEWRSEMWWKGYGKFHEIDRMVEDGELIPGTDYPMKEKSC